MSKVSTVDYPKKIVTTIFTQGCNIDCEYCHNKDLIPLDIFPTLPENEIFDNIDKRRKTLDGICITGGEPTLWGDALIDFIRKIKVRYGDSFLVKLDTNGRNPDFIKKVLNVVDYIALDFKGLYMLNAVWLKSLNLARAAKDYEVRLTMYPKYFPVRCFKSISKVLYYDKVQLQRCVCNDPYSDNVLNDFSKLFNKCKEIK